jgi:hypothetical protein
MLFAAVHESTFLDMSVAARHVCLRGKTGSERLWVKTTQMTLNGHSVGI